MEDRKTSENNLDPDVDEQRSEERQFQDTDSSVSRRAVLGVLGGTGTSITGLGAFSQVGSAASSKRDSPRFNIKEMPGRSTEAFKKIFSNTDIYQAYENRLAADGFQPVTEAATAYKVESDNSNKFLVSWPLQEVDGDRQLADDEQSGLGRGQLVLGMDHGTIKYSGAGFLFKSINDGVHGNKNISLSSKEYSVQEGFGTESITSSYNDSQDAKNLEIKKSSDSRSLTIPTADSLVNSGPNGANQVHTNGFFDFGDVSCVACKAIATAACAVGCGAGAWVICGAVSLEATPISGAVCTIAVGAICAAFESVRHHYTGITCNNGFFIRVACNYAGYC